MIASQSSSTALALSHVEAMEHRNIKHGHKMPTAERL